MTVGRWLLNRRQTGAPIVDVGVEGATTADEALEVALAASGETRPRLFGWTVGEPGDDGRRAVTLHTD